MILDVCPAAVTRAPVDRLWELLTAPELFEHTVTPTGDGATLVRFNCDFELLPG